VNRDRLQRFGGALCGSERSFTVGIKDATIYRQRPQTRGPGIPTKGRAGYQRDAGGCVAEMGMWCWPDEFRDGNVPAQMASVDGGPSRAFAGGQPKTVDEAITIGRPFRLPREEVVALEPCLDEKREGGPRLDFIGFGQSARG